MHPTEIIWAKYEVCMYVYIERVLHNINICLRNLKIVNRKNQNNLHYALHLNHVEVHAYDRMW